MKELKTSGLPIFFDEESKKLIFKDGLTCAGSGEKFVGQMTGLLMNENDLKEDEFCYSFYRDIVFEKDRALFSKYDYRYDITLIDSGNINGEKKKTSGHYHGYIANQKYTYPEIYEVLSGTAVFILQKVMNFDSENEEPVIDELLAVTVREGQAIIIPPFYGHCSINGGNEPLIFSNIAVVSCPLFYEPIKKKHGLSYYLIEENNGTKLVKNPSYNAAPQIKSSTAKENANFGIEFNKPVYVEFVKDCTKFDYMFNPNEYVKQLEIMIR